MTPSTPMLPVVMVMLLSSISSGVDSLFLPGAQCSRNRQCFSNSCVASICECSTCESAICKAGCQAPQQCTSLSAGMAKSCQPSKQLGQTCTSTAQCIDPLATCAGGYCMLKVGAACTSSGSCVGGSCVAGTCECSLEFGFASCASGSYCKVGAVSATGARLPNVCTAAQAQTGQPGDSCSTNTHCLSKSCKYGQCECDSCSYNASTCPAGCISPTRCQASPGTPSLLYCGPMLALTAPCLTSDQCASKLCSGNRCVLAIGAPCSASRPLECVGGKCAGGLCACSSTGPASCPAGSTCTAQPLSSLVCTGQVSLGQPCTTNVDCMTGICSVVKATKICTLKLLGASCAAHSECASGECFMGRCQCSLVCERNPTCVSQCAIGGCVTRVSLPNFCALGQPGTKCTSNGDCASKLCYAADSTCQCASTCVSGPTCPSGCPEGTPTCTIVRGGPNLCGAPQLNGNPCASNSYCISTSCVNFMCVGRPVGASCTVTDQCDTYITANGTLVQMTCVGLICTHA